MPGTNIYARPRRTTVNFDWVDFAAATGHIEYDGFNAVDSGGDNYVLIQSDNKNAVTASSSLTQVNKFTEITTNSGICFDEDFDLTKFQLPRTLEGDAFVRCSLDATGVSHNAVIITAKLRKWDGSSETEIASTASDSFTLSTGTEPSRSLKIPVPRTHFKKGEILRLTITISSSSSATIFRIAHDPHDNAELNFTTGNSRCLVIVPYKLDFL